MTPGSTISRLDDRAFRGLGEARLKFWLPPRKWTVPSRRPVPRQKAYRVIAYSSRAACSDSADLAQFDEVGANAVAE